MTRFFRRAGGAFALVVAGTALADDAPGARVPSTAVMVCTKTWGDRGLATAAFMPAAR